MDAVEELLLHATAELPMLEVDFRQLALQLMIQFYSFEVYLSTASASPLMDAMSEAMCCRTTSMHK